MLLIRLVLSIGLGLLFGWQWWTLNQDQGNLVVVDLVAGNSTEMWWLFAAMSVALSGGLLLLQLAAKSRNDDTPKLSGPVVTWLSILSTLLDIPIPAYGLWLSNHWPADLNHAIAALLLGGVYGSIICQMLAVELLFYATQVAAFMWGAGEDSRPPRKTPPTNAATVATPRGGG